MNYNERPTEELIEIIENGPDYIIDMDESLFADMVESIITKDTLSINFILINSLRMMERL